MVDEEGRDMPQQRTEGEAHRNRRAWQVSAALWLTMAIAALVMSQYPRGQVPISVRGPLFLGLTSVIVAGNLFYERPDEWQRHRALMAFAVGCLGGILWLLAGVAGLNWAGTPGSALGAIGVTWLTSDLLLRMWPSMRASDRS